MMLNENANDCLQVYNKQLSLCYYLILKSLNQESASDVFVFQLWILSHNLIHLIMKKYSSSLSLLPFHKTKEPSLSCSKKKSSLKLLACSCSINWSNLLIAISEYEKEFGAHATVPFVCRRWFLSNLELLLYIQMCSPTFSWLFVWVSSVQR